MNDKISRRTLLRRGAGLGLAATALPGALAACAGSLPGATSGGTGRLPNYIAAKVPKPDEPGNHTGLASGYWHYPTDLVKSVPEVPGSGGDVTALVITYSPPPSPLSGNQYWQELNRRLGVNLQPDVVDEGDWQSKLPTVMASGNLPDFILLFGSVPQELAFLEDKCEDLTPYLAGDAVRQYPNLANIPTYAWIPTSLGGRIYGLPQDRGRMGDGMFIQQNLADQAGMSQLKNTDDFTRLMQELNQPKHGRWAMGAAVNSIYNLGFFQQVFGVPNNWSVDKNGKFTSALETDGTREAVSYLRQLFQKGLFHPEANNMTTDQAKNAFYGGQITVYQDGFSAFQTTWHAVAAVNPGFKTRVIVPFASSGGRGSYYLGAGTFGVTALKKASKKRIEELLRVANFLAAPFGTEEYFFINNGIEGVDYTLDAHGNPLITQRGQAEMTLPIGYGGHDYITGPPWVYVDTQYPDFVRTVHQEIELQLPLGIADPSVGLYSGTAAQQGATLAQLAVDKISPIVAGRAPMSSYGSFLQEWRSQGGDQMRKEYQQAFSSVHKRSRT
ncbi:MAG TPA: extracellular solute-binding protein [Candidatus Dormibacteraeota bacterium]|jgi:putative aldouronate transport system substrate-binding protein|nr:extracellular solute-binding protein [Candidatus Dormibacteraeota bacterium]